MALIGLWGGLHPGCSSTLKGADFHASAACSRANHYARSGSPCHDGDNKVCLKNLFSDGVQKVTLSQLRGLPDFGVSVSESNQPPQKAGLQHGGTIVTLYGIRVHNFEPYHYARETTTDPEMNLIIYRNNQHLEVKASPPNHLLTENLSTWPDE